MTSSFCKFLLVSLVAATSVVAQSSVPTATPTPAPKTKEGFLRFWNMLGKDQGEFVLIKENGTPEGEPLLSAGPGNYYASYIPVPPARYSLKVIRREDPTTTIKTFDVLMRAGVYVTFLVSLSEGKTNIEMLDDTFDPTTTVAGRLTIRHHFPNARVIVTTSTQARSRALSFGETEALDGFPLKPVELKIGRAHV